MQRCFDDAQARRCRRVWLTTTNDNLAAIAFYQQVGMDLCALHRDAVATARRLKPSIPSHAENGIPIRHELEFERILGTGASTSRRKPEGDTLGDPEPLDSSRRGVLVCCRACR